MNAFSSNTACHGVLELCFFYGGSVWLQKKNAG